MTLRSPGTDVVTPSEVPTARLKLRVLSGEDAGREIPLSAGSITVGSGEHADLRLSDAAVSRLHLTLEVLREGVRATDNGSRNGTYCNGLRVSRIELKAGAFLRLGRTELAVLSAESEDAGRHAGNAFGSVVGKSAAMRALFAKLSRLAATDVGVLLTGETGTGKDACARALHEQSGRSAQPLVVCDLGAVHSELIESELFGHMRGAFTGAVSDRPGAFERANGGTVFLDEVGELALDRQTRLLRVLETRTVKRVGDGVDRKVDVRVLAATHRDLEADVKAGRFREDLYHRLSVVVLRVPPLRERAEDLPLLIEACLREQGQPANALSPAAYAQLAGRPWPGNVRQLKNAILEALSLGESALFQSPAPAPPSSQGFKEAKGEVVHHFEKAFVLDLLKRFDGNLAKAARHAKIDRVSLHRIIQKHGLRLKAKDEE